MRTSTAVGLTALVSAAIVGPASYFAHDQLEHNSASPSSHMSAPATPGNTSPDSGTTPSPMGSPTTSGSASTSGTSTLATKTDGVVMIDTVVSGGEGAGTGMVLRSDGTVLTNYHVVNGSTLIRVKVPGGASYSATVVGHDQTHDIAVLKLSNASGLKTVSLDTDNAAKTAESVLAVGQGEGQGVLYAAKGVITALDREITANDTTALATSEALTGLIQVNAPIVPGYSGGPLFNASGKVIGIDTAASASNSSSTGFNPNGSVGFAIPIKSAMQVANDILAGNKTSTNHIGARAALGISVAPTQAGQMTNGITVHGVLPGTGAAASGLAAGDVITDIDGTTISNSTDLSHAMDKKYPGAKVKVTWDDLNGSQHSAMVSLQKSTTN